MTPGEFLPDKNREKGGWVGKERQRRRAEQGKQKQFAEEELKWDEVDEFRQECVTRARRAKLKVQGEKSLTREKR